MSLFSPLQPASRCVLILCDVIVVGGGHDERLPLCLSRRLELIDVCEAHQAKTRLQLLTKQLQHAIHALLTLAHTYTYKGEGRGGAQTRMHPEHTHTHVQEVGEARGKVSVCVVRTLWLSDQKIGRARNTARAPNANACAPHKTRSRGLREPHLFIQP